MRCQTTVLTTNITRTSKGNAKEDTRDAMKVVTMIIRRALHRKMTSSATAVGQRTMLPLSVLKGTQDQEKNG